MERLLLGSSRRTNTISSHTLAVERAIRIMQERLDDPPPLKDMANIACLSPFHFTHVFHWITGIAPRDFLAALRMESAKRILLTTTRSVTEVCFDVGFNSLGTFSNRFTRLVGVTPSRLRELAGQFTLPPLDPLSGYIEDRACLTHGSVTGRLYTPSGFEGLIFIGLFSTPLPQSRPVGCTLVTNKDSYFIPCIPNGFYYLFAAAFIWQQDPMTYLLSHTWLRGSLNECPVLVRENQVSGSTDVRLRPTKVTDPPILFALPFLLT